VSPFLCPTVDGASNQQSMTPDMAASFVSVGVLLLLGARWGIASMARSLEMLRSVAGFTAARDKFLSWFNTYLKPQMVNYVDFSTANAVKAGNLNIYGNWQVCVCACVLTGDVACSMICTATRSGSQTMQRLCIGMECALHLFAPYALSCCCSGGPWLDASVALADPPC
jgi:hypothetical protein